MAPATVEIRCLRGEVLNFSLFVHWLWLQTGKTFHGSEPGDNPTKAEKGLFSDLQLKKTEVVTKAHYTAPLKAYNYLTYLLSSRNVSVQSRLFRRSLI
jgi:hypothetical protein